MKGSFFHRAQVVLLRILVLAILLGIIGQPSEAKSAKALDIADTIATNPILTKLALMMQASDMATFLSSRGPFTVFVPTDSAFSRLPPGMLDTLLRPENKERLQHILLFHVVNGKKLTAKDLIPVTSLVSCEGNPLTLKTTKSGTQFVMKSKIVHADIRCQNGVIHEIDTLLMPPESALPPIAPPPPPAPVTPPAGTTTNAAPVTTPEATSLAPTNLAPVISNPPATAPVVSPN